MLSGENTISNRFLGNFRKFSGFQENVQDFKRRNYPAMAPYKRKALKNFMAPFYGCGSTASRLEPL